MIDYIGISDEARRIKAYFDGLGRIMTPEEVCKLTKKNSGINIDIELVPMETSLGTDVYKANYSYIKRQHIVQYNTRIKAYLDAILYHEIGHRVIHWRCADFVFHLDSDVFGVKTIFEVEANVFSAEMLLDDDKVLYYLFDCGYTFFQAARSLGVPDEILFFKCKILHARGYKINIPITVTGDFMKRKIY